MKDFQKRVAKEIRALSEEKGATAYYVAKTTGLSVNTVYDVFKATGNPSLATVQAVYDCLEALPTQEKTHDNN